MSAFPRFPKNTKEIRVAILSRRRVASRHVSGTPAPLRQRNTARTTICVVRSRAYADRTTTTTKPRAAQAAAGNRECNGQLTLSSRLRACRTSDDCFSSCRRETGGRNWSRPFATRGLSKGKEEKSSLPPRPLPKWCSSSTTAGLFSNHASARDGQPAGRWAHSRAGAILGRQGGGWLCF